jgi:hypothetical protein
MCSSVAGSMVRLSESVQAYSSSESTGGTTTSHRPRSHVPMRAYPTSSACRRPSSSPHRGQYRRVEVESDHSSGGTANASGLSGLIS